MGLSLSRHLRAGESGSRVVSATPALRNNARSKFMEQRNRPYLLSRRQLPSLQEELTQQCLIWTAK